ncbi:hypothetical protein ACOMHN_026829 [Nucella lapillus]
MDSGKTLEPGGRQMTAVDSFSPLACPTIPREEEAERESATRRDIENSLISRRSLLAGQAFTTAGWMAGVESDQRCKSCPVHATMDSATSALTSSDPVTGHFHSAGVGAIPRSPPRVDGGEGMGRGEYFNTERGTVVCER